MRRTWQWMACVLALGVAVQAEARPKKAPEPLYPVQPWLLSSDAIQGKKRTHRSLPDRVYPRAAGEFVVFTEYVGKNEGFRVVRVSKRAPKGARRVIRPLLLGETARFGVAIADGAIGYVSNRLGPISAWMRQAHGDGHVLIANSGVWRGAIAPQHLNASPDGRFWCFDTTFEKNRYNQLLQEFAHPAHWELVGQSWRVYDSRFYRYQMAYEAARAGAGKNHFQPPVLFLFDRRSSELVMIPRAFDGAFSPDGQAIAFVREEGGNYDLWMQRLDGSGLTQLTHSPFADVEPAFSPDGKKIAFVSNRDSNGDVRATSIYVLDLESGKVMRVTNALHASDGGPSWLDAQTILFHSNRDPKAPQTKTTSRWSLWVVKLDR